MSGTKAYNVSIAGVPLRLKSSHSNETVENILKLVDSKLDKKICQTSVQNAAILTCLRLAEELYFIKKQAKDELSRLETLTESLITELQDSPQA
jgi:cell division protein ZapA